MRKFLLCLLIFGRLTFHWELASGDDSGAGATNAIEGVDQKLFNEYGGDAAARESATQGHMGEANSQASGEARNISQLQEGVNTSTASGQTGRGLVLGIAGASAAAGFLAKKCAIGTAKFTKGTAQFASTCVAPCLGCVVLCATAKKDMTEGATLMMACAPGVLAAQQALAYRARQNPVSQIHQQSRCAGGASCSSSGSTAGRGGDTGGGWDGGPNPFDPHTGGHHANSTSGQDDSTHNRWIDGAGSNEGDPWSSEALRGSASTATDLIEKLPPNLRRQLSAQNISTLLNDLKKSGYAYDPKTGRVITPKGSISGQDLSNAERLKALGYTSDQISSLEDALKEATAESLKNSKLVEAKLDSLPGGGALAGSGESGDGGEVHGVAGSTSGDSFDMNAYMRGLRGPASPEDASLNGSGLSRQLAGDPIGVSSDNVFNMIHRRYNSLRINHQILNENGLSVGAPAGTR